MWFHSSNRGAKAARVPWALTAALLLATASPLAGQKIRYDGSLGYSGGTYFFEETTHSIYLNTGLTLDLGRLDLSVSVPLVFQNSGLVSLVGGIPVPTGGEESGIVGQRQPGSTVGTKGQGQSGSGTGKSISLTIPFADPADPAFFDPVPAVALQTDVTTDSTAVVFEDAYAAKFADPLISGSLNLYQGFGALRSVSIRGSVKPPIVGLDSGVGTGEWDFGGGTSVVLGAGSTLLFGDLSYWRYGDLPELVLNDGFGYAGGLSRPFLSTRASIMLTVMGAQSLVPTAEAPLSAGVGFGYIFPSGRTANIGFNAGLSESTPDLSITLGWSLGG